MSAEEAASLTGLFVSPTAVAPKPGAPGQIRVCHNLSAGGANSVNAGIDFDPINPIGLLQLDSFVARIQYMMDLHPGKKIVVSKADMKEFFRQIPVRRRDMARLTQRWKGIVYAHEAFTFGARSAPHVCSAVTNALCDEMARRGFFCQCFIDDCVILAYEDEIEDAVVALRHLIGQFGLVENLVKFVPASQQVAIVGVHFDLEKFTVGITPEKRTSTLELLTAVVRTNVTTVGELRSLAGKLAFLSAVVHFARCYTSFIWKAAGDSMDALGARKRACQHECVESGAVVGGGAKRASLYRHGHDAGDIAQSIVHHVGCHLRCVQTRFRRGCNSAQALDARHLASRGGG